MTIKKILVPLDGTDLSIEKLPTANAAARHFDAHLDVLYLSSDPKNALPYVFGSMGAKGLRNTVLEAAGKAGAEQRDRHRKRFEEFCADNQIRIVDCSPAAVREHQGEATASWREADEPALVRQARLSDMSTVIRTPSDSRPWLLEAMLLETSRPVLLAPPQAPQTLGRHVVLGWNDSAEAVRAVAAALPFLRLADQVTLLSSTRRLASAGELVDYLGWHRIDATVREFSPGGRSVGMTLLKETRDTGGDLLVLGAYSHTRASQLLFGGVTQYVIGHAEVPILLMH